jgi:hypothetical protein
LEQAEPKISSKDTKKEKMVYGFLSLITMRKPLWMREPSSCQSIGCPTPVMSYQLHEEFTLARSPRSPSPMVRTKGVHSLEESHIIRICIYIYANLAEWRTTDCGGFPNNQLV